MDKRPTVSRSSKGNVVLPLNSNSQEINQKQSNAGASTKKINFFDRKSRRKSAASKIKASKTEEKKHRPTSSHKWWFDLFIWKGKSQKNNKIGSQFKPNEKLSESEEKRCDEINETLQPAFRRSLPNLPKHLESTVNKMVSSNQETTSAVVHVRRANSTIDFSHRMPERNIIAQTANQRHPVGLINFGASCFFNAVVQNLYQTHALHDILLDDSKKQKNFRPLTQSLLQLYSTMQRGSQRNSVEPRELFDNICKRSKRFRDAQCDSHELLRHLLDGLRIEERQNSSSDGNRRILTNVDRVFGGHILTVYVCETCQQPYHVCEPILDISLPILLNVGEKKRLISEPKTNYQKAIGRLMEPLSGEQCVQESQNRFKKSIMNKPHSVEDCLDAYTRTEYISEEYLCLACNDEQNRKGTTDYRMTSATKRSLVYNPPAILTLHLKRFEQTARGFVKCNKQITFKETLNLGSYCTSFCERNEGNERSIWYSLYGLIEHSGSLDGGHYVAYVKMRRPDDANIEQFLQKTFVQCDQLTEDKLVKKIMDLKADRSRNSRAEGMIQSPVSGTWFYISDRNCHQVSPVNQVLNCQAYLLFYERLVPDIRYTHQDTHL